MTLSLSFLSGKKVSMYKMISIKSVQNECAQAPGHRAQDETV